MAYTGIENNQKSKWWAWGGGSVSKCLMSIVRAWIQGPSTHLKGQIQQGVTVISVQEDKDKWSPEPTGGLVQLNRWTPCAMRDIASKSKVESLWESLPMLTLSLHVYTLPHAHMCTDTRTHELIYTTHKHLVKIVFNRRIMKRTWKMTRSVYCTDGTMKSLLLTVT